MFGAFQAHGSVRVATTATSGHSVRAASHTSSALDADPGSDFGTIVIWGLQICGATVGGAGKPVGGQVDEPFYYFVPVVDAPVEQPKHTTDLTNSLFLPQVSR